MTSVHANSRRSPHTAILKTAFWFWNAASFPKEAENHSDLNETEEPRVPLKQQTPRRAELHGVESRPQVDTDPRSPEEDLRNPLSKPGTL